MINIPKMILFDYGQTLLDEAKFDGVKGSEAVLRYAVKNKYGRTAGEIQEIANAMNHELGRFDPAKRHLFQVEVPNYMFCSYLYESQGIELSINATQRDKVFWDAASPGTPTKGMEEFLDFLKEQGIRTGVISNISYSGEALTDRINTSLPNHNFEFIIATSEYMYRKPNKRIFDLALEKAQLRAEDVWYIGDNYDCDVVGARNAGIFPIWYVGAYEGELVPREDVLMVTAWSELQGMLKA